VNGWQVSNYYKKDCPSSIRKTVLKKGRAESIVIAYDHPAEMVDHLRGTNMCIANEVGHRRDLTMIYRLLDDQVIVWNISPQIFKYRRPFRWCDCLRLVSYEFMGDSLLMNVWYGLYADDHQHDFTTETQQVVLPLNAIPNDLNESDTLILKPGDVKMILDKFQDRLCEL
jgi:hypothetical protein